MRLWRPIAPLLVVLAVSSPALAQDGLPPASAPPGEVLRLLDAYVVMRAQAALGLDDQQYPVFIQRIRQLQDVRRGQMQERARLLQQLNRLSQRDAASIDEAAIREGLATLADHEGRSQAAEARAVAAVDEVLTLRQRARFRVFEEQMERRKLELVARARANAAPARRRR